MEMKALYAPNTLMRFDLLAVSSEGYDKNFSRFDISSWVKVEMCSELTREQMISCTKDYEWYGYHPVYLWHYPDMVSMAHTPVMTVLCSTTEHDKEKWKRLSREQWENCSITNPIDLPKVKQDDAVETALLMGFNLKRIFRCKHSNSFQFIFDATTEEEYYAALLFMHLLECKIHEVTGGDDISLLTHNFEY